MLDLQVDLQGWRRYAAYGGASGTLGGVASPVMSIAENGGGLGQAYANGSIYWNLNAGAQVVLVDDERCAAVMREFQEHYPEVWSEDIGGR